MADANPRTLKALSERMGVSVTTISRILSGQARRYRISKKTEEAVLAEAARLDFSPNQVAKGLRLQRTWTLGLIIPDIANPFFATLARHVELESRKAGYSVFLCDSEESTAIEIESLQLMHSRHVDGIIISPVGQTGAHLEALQKKGMPIVVVDRYFPQMKLPFVTSDNYKGAYEGVNYLIENGHRRIACIQGLPESASNVDRVRGYREALAGHDIPVDENLIVGDRFDERNGYIETKLLLKRANRPSAIFSLGNLITLGALAAISEEGLKIPDDMSLLAFDEQPYFAYLATPLTTIAQQNADMGEIAVKLMLSRIDRGKHETTEGIVLPTRLNIRDSVRKINNRNNEGSM